MCLFDCLLLLRIKARFSQWHIAPLRPLQPHPYPSLHLQSTSFKVDFVVSDPAASLS